MLHINLRLPYFGSTHSQAAERSLQPHSRSASVMTATSMHPLQRSSRALSITNGDDEHDEHSPDEAARQRLTSCASWMSFYYGPEVPSQAASAMPSNIATPAATPSRLHGSPDRAGNRHVGDDQQGSQSDPTVADFGDLDDSTETFATPGLITRLSNKIPSLLKFLGSKAYERMPELPRPSIQLELRILTRLEFNDSDQIYRHEDSYSVKDVIDALPVVGRLYAAERIIMSYLIGYLSGWLLGGNKTGRDDESSPLSVSLIKAAGHDDDDHSVVSELGAARRSVDGNDDSPSRQPVPFPSAAANDAANSAASAVASNIEQESPRQRVSSENSDRRSRVSSKFGLGLGSSTKSRAAPPRTSRGISYLEIRSPSKDASQAVSTAADKLAAAMSADSASDSADTAPMSPNVDR